MKRLIGWWVHNPVAANLLMLGILLAGLLGFNAMEREAFPLFKPNQVDIEATWPGAAPQEIEEQVILRFEQALKEVENVYRVYATASENQARLEVLTYADVDLNAFLDDVSNAVDATTGLPRDLENVKVQRGVRRDEMARVVVHSNVLSERQLLRLAEDLREELAALPFIAMVDLFGARREEVSIELSERDMRRFGLSFDDVVAAIRASSINLSSGQVRTSTGDVRLRVRNLADDEQDFGRIIVRQTDDGASVYLRDVANIVDGFEDEEILATLDGEPAILLQIMTSEVMQIVKSSEAISQWLEERRPGLPAGVSLGLWSDTADIYRGTMGTIMQSAYLGLLLVFMVLIITLRPTVALWVTVGIAVAFLGTFALLPANNVSLNVTSTFAFLLVLGIVVDDAIVVGESIHHHSHSPGGGGPDSAIEGAFAVSKPVIFAVLTTIIAFAPWFFVSLAEAQVTRQLSVVITVALLISLIEAFLILPAHLRKLRHREKLNRVMRWQKRVEEGLVHFADVHYRRLLQRAVAQRYFTTAAFIALFIVSLGLFSSGWVKFAFMPEVQGTQIYLQAQLPAGNPYARSLEILEQFQAAQRQLVREVEARAQTGGSGQLIEGWYTRARRDSVIAIMELVPPEFRDMEGKEAAERLRELIGDVPDADEIQVSYTIDQNTPGISYVLRHRDADILQAASMEMKAQLQAYEGTFFVRDNLQGQTDELHMQLLPGAQKLGLTLAEVSRQVRQAYYGEEVQRLPRENGDVRVMVRYPQAERRNLQSLRQFRVRTADGREVPLLSVVDVELTSGLRQIQRRDGERMVQITADLAPELMSDIGEDMNGEFLPGLQEKYPGLVILKAGQAENQEFFLSEITALYTVALFMMYALIAVAFRSYWLPLLIMTAIPFGFMGAVYGHLLFGVSMAMFSYFGIGAAAGVVVNDNLVLVDYIGRLRDRGVDAIAAVEEAGVYRFRPILLTTLTTFIGLMPIMAERSINAEFLKPAVLALAFGVLCALFVTLLMVPALYCIGEDIRGLSQRALARLGTRRHSSSAGGA
ncbi:MAG: efflux RND transporter permease subunit [Halieaceae bacterium]|jgi:multidrug efflux pump subunit AcrB|nr:efflux RND transporter permease subunit [Halieaceae bacterium]